MQHEFDIYQLAFEKVLMIQPFSASDNRGVLTKDYAEGIFHENGVDFFPREIITIESRRGVLRGLHFQTTNGQGKILRCVYGKVWCVIVDLRLDSRTFGEWINVDINQQRGVYIPTECAVGTLAIENSVIICLHSREYDGNFEAGILWDDFDLNIDWPVELIEGNIIICEKDKKLQTFADYKKVLERRQSKRSH